MQTFDNLKKTVRLRLLGISFVFTLSVMNQSIRQTKFDDGARGKAKCNLQTEYFITHYESGSGWLLTSEHFWGKKNPERFTSLPH